MVLLVCVTVSEIMNLISNVRANRVTREDIGWKVLYSSDMIARVY